MPFIIPSVLFQNWVYPARCSVDITWNNAAKSNAWLHPPGNLAGQAWNYQLRMIDKTLIHVELRSALASPHRSLPGPWLQRHLGLCDRKRPKKSFTTTSKEIYILYYGFCVPWESYFCEPYFHKILLNFHFFHYLYLVQISNLGLVFTIETT